MWRSRLSQGFGLVGASILAAALVVGVAEAKTFKLGMEGAVDRPETKAALRFAELVKERSNGDITVDVLYAGNAGNERQIAEGLQVGTMHFGVLGGILQNFDQAMMILEWDLLFKNDAHVKAVMNGPLGEKISDRLADKTGIRSLGVFMRTPRLLTTNKPVYELSDIKGMKIRVPEMPARVALWKALGAQPTPMAFPEVPTSLQLGTIDGQENPIGVIYSNKLYDVVDNLALTNHLPGFMLLTVSGDVWNGLNPQEKELISGAAKDAGTFNDQLVKGSENMMLSETSRKMKLTIPVLDPWREATKDVYKQFSDVDGFVELYEAIVEEGKNY